MSDDDKPEVDTVIEQIKDDYGKGSIMNLGNEDYDDIDSISTGSLGLDKALGVGGLPRGRVVEVFGKESTGKSSLALHVIAEAQKQGGLATFIDVEHALDPKYSRAIGVDLDDLYLSQPNSGENALEITEALVESGTMDVVVIDSVAALVPEAEAEGEMSDSQVGLQARLMSKAMRKLTSAISQSKTTVLFVNQVRSTINNTPWGPSTTTSGGRALKFYSSVRLKIYISKTIENGADEKIGNKSTIKVVKNKVAPPFKQAIVDIIYGEGISRERELIRLGEEYDVIERSGAWYSYQDSNIGQGKLNTVNFLKENDDVKQEIEDKVKNKMGIDNG